MKRPGWPSEAEARGALTALGLDPETLTRYEVVHVPAMGGEYWTYRTKPSIDRKHRKRYATRRLAKKALKKHSGWTTEEKKYLRLVRYARCEGGGWTW